MNEVCENLTKKEVQYGASSRVEAFLNLFWSEILLKEYCYGYSMKTKEYSFYSSDFLMFDVFKGDSQISQFTKDKLMISRPPLQSLIIETNSKVFIDLYYKILDNKILEFYDKLDSSELNFLSTYETLNSIYFIREKDFLLVYIYVIK